MGGFFFICAITSLCIQNSFGYLSLSDAEINTFCNTKRHYVLNPTITCCQMKMIKPGINIEEHWEACATPGEGEESISTSSWRVYSCIIKKVAGDEDSITLAKFAELMTKDYDDSIKDSITQEVTSAGSLSASISDSKALDKIRVTYFDIENEVCSGLTTKDYGKSRGCDNAEEENHRGGRCCNTLSLPLDVEWNSYYNLPFPYHIENCNNTLWSTFEKLKSSETIMDNVLLMCDFSCHLVEQTVVNVNDLKDGNYEGYEWKSLPNKLYPLFLSPETVTQGSNFVLENFNITAIKQRISEYEFADILKTNSSTERIVHLKAEVQNITVNGKEATEFIRRTFPDTTVGIPIFCAAQREMLSYVQYSLYQNCGVEEGVVGMTEPSTDAAPETAETGKEASAETAETVAESSPDTTETGSDSTPQETETATETATEAAT